MKSLRTLLTVLAALIAAPAIATAATVHIVAFGDSATEGVLVARNQAYPAQLQAALRAKGHDVQVHNAGVTGDTTAGALQRFNRAIPGSPTSPLSNSESTTCGAASRSRPSRRTSPRSCAPCTPAASRCW